MLKVTIKDPEALCEINQDTLRDYVQILQFEKLIEVEGKHEKWILNKGKHEGTQITILLEDNPKEKAIRMSENLMGLEKVSDLSQLEIWASLTNQEILIKKKNNF